ncbi:carbonic anhydrase [Candidatus Dependentiae bacterium]|nr:carbonic anhydrase [Candidatus Dependentiae bacterium]
MNKMAPTIQKLIDGNKEFRKKFFHGDSRLFDELVAYGQKPKIMIIACSDSRVDPSTIFNCQPGELFTVRNVANLVPPYEEHGTYHGTSAALEFGVRFLCVEQIIVLGHTQCGGIQALVESVAQVLQPQQHSFIAPWMSLARPAYEKVVADHAGASLADKVVLCEQYTLINSLRNLQSFPWIQERVAQRTLAVHAWYLALSTGIIHAYDEWHDCWGAVE